MPTFETEDRPLYPVDQSFVLQVRRGSCPAEALAGRVEHLASGHAARFESAEELVRFITSSMAAAADAAEVGR